MYLKIVGTNIHLLGTLHMLPGDRSDMPEWIWRAYSACDAILYEADLKAEAAFRFLPTDQTLDRLLAPSDWEILSSASNSVDDLATTARLLPAYALFQYFAKLAEVAPGVEIAFHSRAAAEGKKEFYLEPPGFQSKLFSGLSIELVSQLIRTFSSNPGAVKESILAMHKAWLAWDWNQLMEFSSQSPLFSNALLRDVLLDQRNLAWMKFIRPALKTRAPLLIAVGVLHLIGKGSLTDLLQREGFGIEVLQSERT